MYKRQELETARDLFLFTCYTGVAYCDMVTLSPVSYTHLDVYKRQTESLLDEARDLPSGDAHRRDRGATTPERLPARAAGLL